MLSTMTLEMWLMCTVMCISCVGWAYEYYRRKEAELKAHKLEKKIERWGISELCKGLHNKGAD